MGTNERLRRRVGGALLRACAKVGVDCLVSFGGDVVSVRGVFLPTEEPADVAVGVVGDRGRFLFEPDQWAQARALVGDSLDFTIEFGGEVWSPDFGAPVRVDPVAGVVTVVCYRAVVTR